MSGLISRLSLAVAISMVLLGLAGCGNRAAQGHGPTKFAIVHVNVIDTKGGPTAHDMTVLIEGGKIQSIYPTQGKLTTGIVTVDGSGKYLIPGLNDMHAHDTWNPDFNGPLFIANGVTGVRDMFAYDLRAVQERRREVAAGALHPNIYLAGMIVDGVPPSWPREIVVRNATEATHAVDYVKRMGWDFVKIYSSLSPSSYLAIVKEAKRIGIPFEGHVPDLVPVAEVSDAGQRTVEHMMDIAVSCADNKDESRMRQETVRAYADGTQQKVWLANQIAAPGYFDRQKCQELFAKFVRNDTWQVPTLTVERVNGSWDDKSVYEPRGLKYVPFVLKWIWGSARSEVVGQLSTNQLKQIHNAFVSNLIRLVGEMHKDGVPIMTGTDSPNPFVVPGFSLHDELDNLVEAGFTPMEALQASTIMPAKFLGRLKSMGTVTQGKDANLVLLDADPLANIDNTRRIDSVVLNGQLITKPVLQALLARASADRWYLGPASIMMLTVIWNFGKYYILGGLAVLFLVIGGSVYFLRRYLRARRKRNPAS